MKNWLLGLLLGLNLMSFAQNKKDVLFTIDGKPYYSDEFKRVYNKNLDLVKDESQKDLNQYLELFVGYKLKVNKANMLGLQNADKYKTELKGYRTQLAKSYFTDSKISDILVKEAYDRSLKEVKASHILILCDENAAPTDSLKAYNLAKEILEKANKGEDFGVLATQFSQDPSAKDNKGNLGYFSVLRMVYPFESAAFKTEKGKVSKITRTRFGFHIIKVEDVRDNRGEVLVAHIMINKPAGNMKEDADKASNTIQDIYKKIQQGESFESLAKLYSEDKASGPKGGVLNRFGSGQLSSEEFENAAFSLTKDKPLSEPFLSQFGWHIVKLIEKYPAKSMKDMKSELEEKILKDDRSKLITSSINEKLRKKYKIAKDKKVYDKIQKAVTDSYYDKKWELPADSKTYSESLVTIADKKINGEEFLNYLKNQESNGSKLKPINKLVDKLYKNFEDENLSSYYNDNLEKEFPEFSNVMEEYRDGLLLFDLMEKEIWDKSKNDTIGLKKFYDLNKEKYQWKTRLELSVASSTDLAIIKKAKEMMILNKTAQEIKDALNTKDKVNIMISNGIYEEGSTSIPKGTKQQTGLSEITKDGEYNFVSNVAKVLPAGIKKLDECKGKVINDYQQNLEENWVSNLKKEFKVEINQDILAKVKNEIQHK
jgi:peptidyl-prolyl cis-trans isomerase SurA